MITDGGGYMLFGRTNTSVTWTVPSSNDAVEPYGNPHWASHLGDAPILDLRIQVARTEDLSKPLAHWYIGSLQAKVQSCMVACNNLSANLRHECEV